MSCDSFRVVHTLGRPLGMSSASRRAAKDLRGEYGRVREALRGISFEKHVYDSALAWRVLGALGTSAGFVFSPNRGILDSRSLRKVFACAARLLHPDSHCGSDLHCAYLASLLWPYAEWAIWVVCGRRRGEQPATPPPLPPCGFHTRRGSFGFLQARLRQGRLQSEGQLGAMEKARHLGFWWGWIANRALCLFSLLVFRRSLHGERSMGKSSCLSWVPSRQRGRSHAHRSWACSSAHRRLARVLFAVFCSQGRSSSVGGVGVGCPCGVC